MRLRPRDLIVIGFVALVVSMAVAVPLAATQDVVALSFAAGLATFVGLVILRLLAIDLRRRRLQRRFGRNLPRALIDRMLATGVRPAIEGEKRHVSILYAAIDDFAPILAESEPKRVFETLNRHVAAMTAVVEAHQGFVDKVIGDAVVAVFGAPVADDRHAEHAVAAAMAMRRLAEEEEAASSPSSGRPLRIRIGVDAGIVLAGTIGSARRRTYTVIGDTVTLAARLADANRSYGTRILVGEEAGKACAVAILLREAAVVSVPDRETPATLLEPLATQEDATESDRERASAYAAAYFYWRTGRLAAAAAAFRAFADDPVAAALAERALALAAALSAEPDDGDRNEE